MYLVVDDDLRSPELRLYITKDELITALRKRHHLRGLKVYYIDKNKGKALGKQDVLTDLIELREWSEHESRRTIS